MRAPARRCPAGASRPPSRYPHDRLDEVAAPAARLRTAAGARTAVAGAVSPRGRRSRGSRRAPRWLTALAAISVGDPAHARRGLCSHGQLGRVERHLRPPVADDHDARHLLGVALADDELVAARDATRAGPTPSSRSRGSGRPAGTGREPATSEPCPRRMLVCPPNAEPSRRRRGQSGTGADRAPGRSPGVTARGRAEDAELVLRVGLRTRHALEARARGTARAPRPGRARRASARNAGVKTMRCAEHGQEERLDVVGLHVVAPVEQRPRPRRPARARGSPGPSAERNVSSSSRVALHELDDPAAGSRRRCRRPRSRAGARATSSSATTGRSRSSGCSSRWPRTISISSSIVG